MRAAIVLAAGCSRRFGRADKLFATLGGEALLLRAIRLALVAPAVRVIVVAGSPARVRSLVRGAGLSRVTVVAGAGRDVPLSLSLRAGIAALRPIERDAFVFLGDMPFVDPSTAARLLRVAGHPAIVRPAYRGAPGHPVLIRAVRTVPGGGERPEAVRIAGGASCVADVDRRGDLARARRWRRG